MASHRLPEPEDKSVKAARIRFCHRCDSMDFPRHGGTQKVGGIYVLALVL